MLGYATPRYEGPGPSAPKLIGRAIGFAIAAVLLLYSVVLTRRIAAVPPAAVNPALQQQMQQMMQASQKQQAAMMLQMQTSMEASRRIACQGNMIQINGALLQYSRKHEGSYPAALDDLVQGHFLTPDLLSCPAQNMTMVGMGTPASPAGAAGENDRYIYLPGVTASSTADTIVLYESLANHGGQGMNVLYHNGHVEFLERSTAERVLAELRASYNPPRYGHY